MSQPTPKEAAYAALLEACRAAEVKRDELFHATAKINAARKEFKRAAADEAKALAKAAKTSKPSA